ncbi:hypothetical protein O4J56_18090 [Nocardiopsis sp. RSe5-2]|uniref:Pyridoxamine 5'-phosphate oxidase family protein n=1 Tax=Nocardiopsis endophytica TaxID=3018445 RepID=A0ABT4U6I8_9ACTN|nr:hypothetical protein [Nocardiopsis endophytica]MDA2812560.1 hypothetical protein [Nocardiopsis endophytica]
MTAPDDISGAWRRAVTGELCWTGPSGPAGIPVVPLVLDGRPCAALPAALLAEADTLTSGRAAFALTSERHGGPGMAASGPVEVVADADGSLFTEHLLAQELVKHPPTRLRADSLMAQRENWWWLPRVVVVLSRVEAERELPVRSAPEDAVLVRPAQGTAPSPGAGAGTAEDPRVDVVTADAWPGDGADPVRLRLADGSPPDGRGERAFLFGHRHSPDFERWERWHRAGTVTGDRLSVEEAEGDPVGEVAPFGVFERLRNHRELVKACKAGVAALEARRGTGG